MLYLNLFNETQQGNNNNQSNYSIGPQEAVLIAFHIGRVISILCIFFGIIGNIALLISIFCTSFYHFPYGLLVVFISIFDIIRLFASMFFYLILANVIPLTSATVTIFVVLYRYSRSVTNWLKAFLAVERYLAVKYWIAYRYNVHSNDSKRFNRSRQRKVLVLIFLLLLCCLISQHPNFFPNRLISSFILSTRLIIASSPNPYFYYGKHLFNGFLFLIITYVIIDDALPMVGLIIFNTILLYELRNLPALTSKKLAESILILFLLTIFSIFAIPRSFFVIFSLYVDQQTINDTVFAITFHIFQGMYLICLRNLSFYSLCYHLGLELVNHALTGYACFLSCQSLRKNLIQNIQTILKKFRYQNNRSKLFAIELHTISMKRS